jgi:hypothetical protein
VYPREGIVLLVSGTALLWQLVLVVVLVHRDFQVEVVVVGFSFVRGFHWQQTRRVFAEVSVGLDTDCGFNSMFVGWRLTVGSVECVSPLDSCTWPDSEHGHAVMVRLMAALVDVCFDARGYGGCRQHWQQ